MAMVDSAVTVGESWDASSYAAKQHLLDVVRSAQKEFYGLVSDPDNWEVQVTDEWQVRDLAAHLVDVIEGYLGAFDHARNGTEPPTPFGTRIMKDKLNQNALAFRTVHRDDLLKRLSEDFATLMETLEGLDEKQWTSFMVCHPYMGPVPPFCYPAFQLMDYGVHSWDIREALGRFSGLNPDVADFLVPFMFILMQGTHDAEKFPDLPGPIGFRVYGRNGGTWKVTISGGSFQFEPGPVDDLASVFEFDPASFVLTTYARIHGGTEYGDRELADSFRGMFFAI
jgi:uncharacterized protein (TIGR03083 family)